MMNSSKFLAQSVLIFGPLATRVLTNLREPSRSQKILHLVSTHFFGSGTSPSSGTVHALILKFFPKAMEHAFLPSLQFLKDLTKKSSKKSLKTTWTMDAVNFKIPTFSVRNTLVMEQAHTVRMKSRMNAEDLHVRDLTDHCLTLVPNALLHLVAQRPRLSTTIFPMVSTITSGLRLIQVGVVKRTVLLRMVGLFTTMSISIKMLRK